MSLCWKQGKKRRLEVERAIPVHADSGWSKRSEDYRKIEIYGKVSLPYAKSHACNRHVAVNYMHVVTNKHVAHLLYQ